MNKLLLTLAFLSASVASAEMHVKVQGFLTEIDANGILLVDRINADLDFKSVGDSIKQQEGNDTLIYTLVDSNEKAFTITIEITANQKQDSHQQSREENSETLTHKAIENNADSAYDFIIGFTAEWNTVISIGLGNNSNESVSLSISSYKN